MKFEYSITLADYQAAQSLHWRQTFARRVLNFLIYDGIPCLAAATACALMKRVRLLGSTSSYWFEFLLGLAIAGIYLLITSKRRKTRRFKKKFEQRFPPEKCRAWAEFNDEGITSAIIGTAPVSHTWDSLIGFAQDHRVILFYLAKNKFLIVTASAMSPSQHAELNSLVAHHVTER